MTVSRSSTTGAPRASTRACDSTARDSTAASCTCTCIEVGSPCMPPGMPSSVTVGGTRVHHTNPLAWASVSLPRIVPGIAPSPGPFSSLTAELRASASSGASRVNVGGTLVHHTMALPMLSEAPVGAPDLVSPMTTALLPCRASAPVFTCPGTVSAEGAPPAASSGPPGVVGPERFGVGELRFGVGELRFGVGELRFGVGELPLLRAPVPDPGAPEPSCVPFLGPGLASCRPPLGARSSFCAPWGEPWGAPWGAPGGASDSSMVDVRGVTHHWRGLASSANGPAPAAGSALGAARGGAASCSLPPRPCWCTLGVPSLRPLSPLVPPPGPSLLMLPRILRAGQPMPAIFCGRGPCVAALAGSQAASGAPPSRARPVLRLREPGPPMESWYTPGVLVWLLALGLPESMLARSLSLLPLSRGGTRRPHHIPGVLDWLRRQLEPTGDFLGDTRRLLKLPQLGLRLHWNLLRKGPQAGEPRSDASRGRDANGAPAAADPGALTPWPIGEVPTAPTLCCKGRCGREAYTPGTLGGVPGVWNTGSSPKGGGGLPGGVLKAAVGEGEWPREGLR